MERASPDRLVSSDGGSSSDRRDGAAHRVLLVDGHQDTLDLYQMTLESAGFITDIATTGAAAWTLMSARLPSVIVTEIVLPGMDGFHLVARIRGDNRTREIPIVLLTTYPPQKLDQYSVDMRIDAVLTKPCSPADLTTAVTRAAGNARPGRRLDGLIPGAEAALSVEHRRARHKHSS
jgi:CheY-like chemotaxis protein